MGLEEGLLVGTPGTGFGFTGDTVAITFGDLAISSTLVAYRLSGLDWRFTNITVGATHLFISPETEGINLTSPISSHTFEMRVTNWGYGVQVEKVHVAVGQKLEASFLTTEHRVHQEQPLCRGMSHQWFYTVDTSWRAREVWGDEPEPWDFSNQQAANLVIVNLGRNDANVSINVSATAYVELYKRLIQGVHGIWPDAQVVIMKTWQGFYLDGNSYTQNTDFAVEAYQVYEYFNSEEYLYR